MPPKQLRMIGIRNIQFIVLILFISCSSQKKPEIAIKNLNPQNVLGKYAEDTSPYKTPTHTALEILADKKVKYYLNREILGIISIDGKWTLNKDTLMLSFNLPEKVKKGSLTLECLDRIDNNGMVIKVVDETKQPLLGASVIINNKLYEVNDHKGEIHLPSIFIDSLQVSFIRPEKKSIKIGKKIDKNLLLVYQSDEERSLVYDFIVSNWLVQNNKLIALKNGKVVDDEKNINGNVLFKIGG